jgi:hypothetical protein
MARIFADEIEASDETIQSIEEIGQLLSTAYLPPKE